MLSTALEGGDQERQVEVALLVGQQLGVQWEPLAASGALRRGLAPRVIHHDREKKTVE